MSKITTEDCKSFLAELYKDKAVANWKRVRKFKNTNGDVCREFNYSDGTVATLIEKNGQLLVKELNTDLSSSNISIYKGKKADFTSFDAATKKAAKKLVNAFVNPEDDRVEPEASDKGFNAIPNLLYFSFLEDANCDETEYLEEIVDQMNFNAPMKDIVVFFMPTTVGSMCDHISPLVTPFLTIPMYECEEMSFKTDDGTPTVTDVFEQLSKSGFVYNPKGCALKNLFSQYQIISVSPTVNAVDKTPELKKEFISAVKKDDVTKLKSLIANGLPLNFKIGKESLLGYAMNCDKIECFKYLTTLYPNTADLGNGICDQVWQYLWCANSCSHYFLTSVNFDFSQSNQKSHDELAMTVGHQHQYFTQSTIKINPEFFSLSCIELTFTYDRFYPLFQDYVKKAIEDYPQQVSLNKKLTKDLVYGFIIPPILDLLVNSSCSFNGKDVFKVVQDKIKELGANPQGYRNKINEYKDFLKRHEAPKLK